PERGGSADGVVRDVSQGGGGGGADRARLTAEQGKQGAALDGRWRLGAGEFEQGGGQVGGLAESVARRTGRETGDADQEREAGDGIVERPAAEDGAVAVKLDLPDQVVLSVVEAVVAGHDHGRLFPEAHGAKAFQEVA